MTKQGFRLDLLDKLMVCFVKEPLGVVTSPEELCRPFRMLPFTNTLSFPGITYLFKAFLLVEPSFSKVAENGLYAGPVSECGVVSAWTEDLHPCFVWVLNMLDCIILGSMGIGEVTKHCLPLDLL